MNRIKIALMVLFRKTTIIDSVDLGPLTIIRGGTSVFINCKIGEVNISEETAKAIKSFFGTIMRGVEQSPNSPVYELFTCGCLGPLPECHCKKRRRLINEFIENVK